MIIALYHHCNGNWRELQHQTGVSDGDLRHFLEYAAQFLGNVGNYKGFGDSKFVPRLSPSSLEKLVSKTPKAKNCFEAAKANGGGIFADTSKPNSLHLGFPDQGHLSNY